MNARCKRYWGWLVTAICLLTPAASWALTLGEAELVSRYSQRLKVRVPIIFDAPRELENAANLSLRLLPDASYEALGLAPPALAGNALHVRLSKSGHRYWATITSARALRLPALSLLLEARLEGAATIRELSLLFDLPARKPSRAKKPRAAVRSPPQEPAAPVGPVPAIHFKVLQLALRFNSYLALVAAGRTPAAVPVLAPVAPAVAGAGALAPSTVMGLPQSPALSPIRQVAPAPATEPPAVLPPAGEAVTFEAWEHRNIKDGSGSLANWLKGDSVAAVFMASLRKLVWPLAACFVLVLLWRHRDYFLRAKPADEAEEPAEAEEAVQAPETAAERLGKLTVSTVEFSRPVSMAAQETIEFRGEKFDAAILRKRAADLRARTQGKIRRRASLVDSYLDLGHLEAAARLLIELESSTVKPP